MCIFFSFKRAAAVTTQVETTLEGMLFLLYCVSNDVAAALSAAQRVGARSFNSFSNSSHGKLTKSFTDEDARKTFRSVEHSLLHSSSMTYCRSLTVTVGFCLGNAVVWWQRRGILLVLLSCSAAEVFFGGMSIGVVRSSLGIGILDGLIRMLLKIAKLCQLAVSMRRIVRETRWLPL